MTLQLLAAMSCWCVASLAEVLAHELNNLFPHLFWSLYM